MELTKVQTGQIFDRLFEGDKLISEIFQEQILIMFYWPIQSLSPFFKKLS